MEDIRSVGYLAVILALDLLFHKLIAAGTGFAEYGLSYRRRTWEEMVGRE